MLFIHFLLCLTFIQSTLRAQRQPVADPCGRLTELTFYYLILERLYFILINTILLT
jgi:hypothetical protein